MTLEYITTRDLTNSAGELRGKVRIMKTKEEEQAQLEITCPECGVTQKRKENWTEPFVNGAGAKQAFTIKCSKCKFATKLLKLKKEAMKKK